MTPQEMKALEAKCMKRLFKARMGLVLLPKFWFYGTIALRLDPKAMWTAQIPTFATDGKKMYFNPQYCERCTDDELRGIWAHESMHPASGHNWRRDTRDAEVWNWACDYVINPFILNAGLKLPSSALVDEDRFNGKSEEQVYAILMEEERQRQQQPQQDGEGEGDEQEGDGEGDDGDGGGESEQQGSGSGKPGKGKPAKAKGAGKQASDGEEDGAPQPGQVHGQGQGGPMRPQRRKPATFGEVIDAPAESAAHERAEWQKAVQQAVELCKSQGHLPAGMERHIHEFVEAKIDWKAVLRRFVQQTAKMDYSFRMPSPRFQAAGLYMPRIHSEQMPPIVIGVDTSGSIGEEELRAFVSEISSIIEEVKPELTHVVYCDAEIPENGVQEFQPGDELIYKPAGGGGTSFKPVFEWIEAQGLQPACVIYLTDCIGDYPEQEPEYPTLWASSTKEESLRGSYHPPFGDFLYIGE